MVVESYYRHLCSLTLLRLVLSTPHRFPYQQLFVHSKGRAKSNWNHDHSDHVYSQQINTVEYFTVSKKYFLDVDWTYVKWGRYPRKFFDCSQQSKVQEKDSHLHSVHTDKTDLKKEPDHIHKNSMECKISKLTFPCTDRYPQKGPYLTGPLAYEKKWTLKNNSSEKIVQAVSIRLT